ncbi:MAG: hypothetical protein QOD75_1231 [Blastocatellia bacterium]|jgi:hypothetical protein|nr:hypothetical protein [Blastocatellia bacterium]
MNKIDAIRLTLTVISGICWTVVYLDGIRLGFKHRSYAIPFFALALNISWELLYTYHGFRTAFGVQTLVNLVWLLLDIGILVTYFKFGRRYFQWSYPPKAATDSDTITSSTDPSKWFIPWSVLVLLVAFCVEFAFTREFRVTVAAGYSAFLQNLLMSVLFIGMLVRRGSREGQSLTIAVSKWLGTLAPTILFGVVGDAGFPSGSFLILSVGLLCSVFDLIYIWLLTSYFRTTSVSLA